MTEAETRRALFGSFRPCRRCSRMRSWRSAPVVRSPVCQGCSSSLSTTASLRNDFSALPIPSLAGHGDYPVLCQRSAGLAHHAAVGVTRPAGNRS